MGLDEAEGVQRKIVKSSLADTRRSLRVPLTVAAFSNRVFAWAILASGSEGMDPVWV